MRLFLIAILIASPAALAAHPGHIAEAAGHGHWVAGAAIGAAIALGLWEAWKGRAKDRDKDEPEDEEAPA